MGNDNLRAALQHVGLQPDDLAEIVEVDVKTVRRWLSGRPPYPRHRGKVARALDTTIEELWPELAAAKPGRPAAASSSDLLAGYPASHDAASPDWHALMRAASERIELLDETLLHVLETDGVVDLLASKAAEGCEIRILIAEVSHWIGSGEGTHRRSDLDLDDDEQEDHNQREAEAKWEAWLDANERARDLLQPLIGVHGIEVHGYVASRFNTILRFDEQMLVTLHLWARSTLEAPLLHLQRTAPDGLFDRFAEHYETLWDDASLPIEPGYEPESDIDYEQPSESCADAEPPASHEPAAASQHPPTGPPADSPPNPARPRRWPRQPPPATTAQ